MDWLGEIYKALCVATAFMFACICVMVFVDSAGIDYKESGGDNEPEGS